MNKKQKGFGIIEVLIIFAVLALIGFGGYYVWKSQANSSDTAFTPAPSVPCEGEWFDSHTHLDDMEFSHDIANRMRDNNVGCSVIFTHVDLNDLEISMLEKREEFAPNPGRFVLFADIIRQDTGDVTRQDLDNLWAKHPGIFKGIGENAFYRPPHKGTSLQAEPWPTIFKFAAEKDIFIMLHVTPAELNDLKVMLATYPDTKVLFHHRELIAELPDLMGTHKNLYYTLDTTNLTTITKPGQMSQDVLLFPQSEANQDHSKQFLSKLQANKAGLLKQASEDWGPLFKIAPDRIFWGTDVAMDWHTNKEVYDELVDFSDKFVKQLPADVQKAYKFDNALKAFGPGITLDDLTQAEINKLDSSTEDEE